MSAEKMVKKIEPGVTIEEFLPCYGEECAGWIETQDECAIKQLAMSLGYISLDSTQLLEKLPHKGQFKR